MHLTIQRACVRFNPVEHFCGCTRNRRWDNERTSAAPLPLNEDLAAGWAGGPRAARTCEREAALDKILVEGLELRLQTQGWNSNSNVSATVLSSLPQLSVLTDARGSKRCACASTRPRDRRQPCGYYSSTVPCAHKCWGCLRITSRCEFVRTPATGSCQAPRKKHTSTGCRLLDKTAERVHEIRHTHRLLLFLSSPPPVTVIPTIDCGIDGVASKFVSHGEGGIWHEREVGKWRCQWCAGRVRTVPSTSSTQSQNDVCLEAGTCGLSYPSSPRQRHWSCPCLCTSHAWPDMVPHESEQRAHNIVRACRGRRRVPEDALEPRERVGWGGWRMDWPPAAPSSPQRSSWLARRSCTRAHARRQARHRPCTAPSSCCQLMPHAPPTPRACWGVCDSRQLLVQWCLRDKFRTRDLPTAQTAARPAGPDPPAPSRGGSLPLRVQLPGRTPVPSPPVTQAAHARGRLQASQRILVSSQRPWLGLWQSLAGWGPWDLRHYFGGPFACTQ